MAGSSKFIVIIDTLFKCIKHIYSINILRSHLPFLINYHTELRKLESKDNATQITNTKLREFYEEICTTSFIIALNNIFDYTCFPESCRQ